MSVCERGKSVEEETIPKTNWTEDNRNKRNAYREGEAQDN